MTAPLVSKPDAPDKKEKKREKNSVQTKVVIRRLPPSMTEAEFLDAISPLPDHDYIRFVKADFTLDQDAFCRAYINFIESEDIYTFQERFDGYVFVDGKGTEFSAVVEFAPNQKVGLRRDGKKKDQKINTIEQDTDYLKFLEILEKGAESSGPSVEQNLDEIETREREAKAGRGPEKQTTPLIQFLKEKKEEKIKKREELKEQKKKRDEERKKARDEERLKRKEAKEKELKEKEKEKGEKRNDQIEEDIKIRQAERKHKRDKEKERKDKDKECIQVKESDNVKDSETKEPSTTSENDASEKKDKREIEKEKRLAREEKEKERFRKREEEKLKQREKKKELIEKRKEKERAEKKKDGVFQEEKNPKSESVNCEDPKVQYTKEKKDASKPLPPQPAASVEVKEEVKTKKYSDRRKEERLKREKEKMDKSKKKDIPVTTTTSPTVEVKADDNIIDIDDDSSKDDDDKTDRVVFKPTSVKSESATDKSFDSVDSCASEYKKPFRERKSEERPNKDRRGKRPDMQVYRPGMGKFSSRTIKKEEEDKEKSSPRTSPDESRETSPTKRMYEDDKSQIKREYQGRGSRSYRLRASDEDFPKKSLNTEAISLSDDMDKIASSTDKSTESNEMDEKPVVSAPSVIRDEDITPLTAAVSVITIDNDNQM